MERSTVLLSSSMVRLKQSRPLIEDLAPWLRAKLTTISQKTKLAKAIG